MYVEKEYLYMVLLPGMLIVEDMWNVKATVYERMCCCFLYM